MEACAATGFEAQDVIEKYHGEQDIVQAAAKLVDHGRAGRLSRLEETIEFARLMKYKKIGLAYCYGMEKDAAQIVALLRENGLNVSATSCTVGGISQTDVNMDSEICNVSCNPIGQAAQLNKEEADFVITMGLCMGHEILFNREVQADVSNFLVKDRVHQHAPLKALKKDKI